MGIIQAFTGAISGTFADQWRDIITSGSFDEHTVVAPGILKSGNNRFNSNISGSMGVISSGSRIYVPENTACCILDQSGIEEIITEPGGYEYENGQESVFSGSGFGKAILKQAKERIGYGGVSVDDKHVIFINLREIRDIKFGTRGPQVYHDVFYGTDLEVFAYGSFTIQIKDPIVFIRNFLPANINYYSFDEPNVRAQILSEFLQSFTVALNSLSETYRISQLPAQANALASKVANDSENAGTWRERFGFEIIKVAVENIEFTDDSRELVKQYSSSKMNIKAYDGISQRASDIAAQQKIAQGIQDNGLGNTGGMVFGMNMAQNLGTKAEAKSELSLDEQIESLKKLKELVDAGILTEEEFEMKKKEIMGL